MTSGLRARLYLAAALAAVMVAAIAIGIRQEMPAAVIAIVIGVVTAEVAVRTMLDAVRTMTLAADALGKEGEAVRARVIRDDELGELGRAIDGAADRLRDRLAAARLETDRFRLVLDSMVEAVFATDARGTIVLENAALVRLLGTAATHGRTVLEAIRSPVLHDAMQEALSGVSSSVRFDMAMGGETRSLAAQLSPLPHGRGVVCVLHDVTEIQRADTVRRDFVANASHELRTPLTAIRGFAETLRDGAVEDPATSRRFIELIVEHALRLEALVDDLLELSRAESPDVALELGPVDVGALASRVVRAFESKAESKRIAVRMDIESWVRVIGDERALDHVLTNLVDNALKYTPDGGRVRITSRAGPPCRDTAEPTIEVEVSDTGPGIAASQQQRIFERFYRVDPGRSRAAGGTGLGLAIVKHLVHAMGGDATVESRTGQGATFRVRLRAARA